MTTDRILCLFHNSDSDPQLAGASRKADRESGFDRIAARVFQKTPAFMVNEFIDRDGNDYVIR